MKNIRESRLFWFLKNVCCLFRCDIYKDLAELKLQTKTISDNVVCLRDRQRYSEVMLYNEIHQDKAKKYEVELSYLQKYGIAIFPYEKIKSIGGVNSGFDSGKKLPWVEHQSKRLYFPSNYSIESAVSAYKNFIETENILGGGYRTKSPHQYQSDTFKVEAGDVFVDVGCAEGLVALDVIEKVKKVYLIESDVKWLPALMATFEPYKDKVVIANKLIADSDDSLRNTTTLSSLLKEENSSSLFIKMDIEGYETIVVESSKCFLQNRDSIKLACCTYHKAGDEDKLKTMFESFGFQTEYSDGYMLFWYDYQIRPPYFRKGIIRAWK